MSKDFSTLIDSTSLFLTGDFLGLRERADVEGYLFFRNVIPRADIEQVRADLLAVVERHGFRQPGQDTLGGRVELAALNQVPDREMRLDIGVSHAAYHDVQKLQSFHRLPHHPRLQELFRGLLDGEILVHPRHIARMITGQRNMAPTPAHQDFPLIQGSQGFWTSWIPLGDCPRAMGGLAVLRGSHRQGYIPIQPAAGAGGIAVQLCPGEAEWVTTDYAAGDVLTFPCCTVHRGLPSTRPDEIRLSLDLRYQRADEPVEQKSLLPHCDLSWEEIYAGWTGEDLKYYWRKQDPENSTWDDTLLQPGRRIC